MTAVANDDYGLANVLTGEAIIAGPDACKALIETTFQLNKFILGFWAQMNGMPLPAFWAEFSTYMEAQGGWT